MSRTAIETMLWHIQREIMQRRGATASENLIAPLTWYISTGRAPTEFLKKLYETRPVLVARDLAKGGTYDEVINRICQRIGFSREY